MAEYTIEEIYAAIDANEEIVDKEAAKKEALARYEAKPKDEEVVEEDEGKKNGSLPAGADVDQKTDASKIKDTDSVSEDGSSESEKEVEEKVKAVDENITEEIEEVTEEQQKINEQTVKDLKQKQIDGKTLTEEETNFLSEYESEPLVSQPIKEQVIKYNTGALETYPQVIDNFRNLDPGYLITGKKSQTFYNFEKGKAVSVRENITDQDIWEARLDQQAENIDYYGTPPVELDGVILNVDDKFQRTVWDAKNLEWVVVGQEQYDEIYLEKSVDIPSVEKSIQEAIDAINVDPLTYNEYIINDRGNLTADEFEAVNVTQLDKVADIKSRVFREFVMNNKAVKEIVTQARYTIKYDEQVDKYRDDYAKKYPLTTPAEIAANIDKITVNPDGSIAYTAVGEFGSSLINEYLVNNKEFFTMLTMVENKINDRLVTDYEDYKKNKNTAWWLRWSINGSKAGGYNIQSLYNQYVDQSDKGKQADAWTEMHKMQTGYDKSVLESESENGFEDTAIGYYWDKKSLGDTELTWGDGEEGTNGKTSYQFYILNDGEKLPIGARKVDFSLYKSEVGKLATEEAEKATKIGSKLLNNQEIAQYFQADKYTEEAISSKGKGSVAANLGALAIEQGANMLFAIATLGTGPGYLMAQETYFDLLKSNARKRFKLSKDKEPTDLQLLEMLEDDPSLVNKLKFRANVTGTVYGGVEAASSYFVVGKALKPAISSVLRMQMKEMLKNSIKTGVRLTATGLVEGTTEFFSELTAQIGKGNGINTSELYQSARTGFVAGVTLMGIGKGTMQTITEVKSSLGFITSKLDKNSAEAYLGNAILEFDNTDTTNFSPQEEKDFIEKRQAYIDYRNASKGMPSGLSDKDKSLFLDNATQIFKLERESKNAGLDPVNIQIADLKQKNKQLQEDANLLLVLQGKAGKLQDIFNEANTGETLKVAKTTKDNVKIIEDLNNDGWIINEEDSTNYGNIYNRGEETIVVLNLEQAVSDKKIATTEHEFLHTLLRKTFENRPKVQKAVAQELSAYLQKLEGGWDDESNFGRRLAQYKKRQLEGKISESDFYQETMTLFAEGLVEGEIIMPKNRLQELKQMFERVFKAAMVAAGLSEKQVEGKFEFNTAEDVAKFIMNANKAIKTGKLTSAQKQALSPGGITGNLLNEASSEENLENTRTSISASLKENKQQLTPEIQDQVILDLDLIKEFKKDTENKLNNEGEAVRKDRGQTMLENSIIEAISPTVKALAENRTKALFDNIPDGLKAGLTREQFRQGLIDDFNLMVLNEYDPSKGDLEKFLMTRGFLRAYSKATRSGVKQQFDDSLDTAALFDIADTATDAVQEDVMVRKEISPSALLGEELQLKATQSVYDELTRLKIDINKLSYKEIQKLKTLSSESVAEFFGVKVNKITNAKDNLTTSEALSARMSINKNADQLLAMLPEGHITRAGAKESLIGTSTGVPLSLLKLFYTKSDKRGKNLTPWVLRKDIKRAEFLKAFGINADGTFNAKADGQKIKALMTLMQGNISNEIIRGIPGISKEAIVAIEKGKSKNMASLKDSKYFTPAENGLIKSEDMLIKVSDAFGIDSDYKNLMLEDTRDLIAQYLEDEDGLLKSNPTAYAVLREVYENDFQAKAEEGRNTKGFTTVLKNQLKNSDFNSKYPGLSELLVNGGGYTLMSDAVFKGNTAEGKAAREQFKELGIDFANEIGGAFNFDSNYNVEGQGAGSNPISFMIGLFGGHQGIIGKNGEALVTSDWKNSLRESLKNSDGRTTFLSEELITDLQNFDFSALTTTYATSTKNKYLQVMAIKDPVKRKALAAKLFNTKGAKAQVQMYSLFNRALEEWLHVETPGSKAWNKKADYILKLKKGNSAAGLTGERILSPPGYMYLGDETNFTTKVEHLMPSSNMSEASAMLILQNNWKEKGVEVLGEYQAIYGTLSAFNKVDAATGKVNSSGVFRFAYNLDLAKDIYKIEGGFKISLYDEMKSKIYDIEGRGKVRGEVLIKEIENKGEAIFNNNSALLHDIGRSDLIPITSQENPKYASNQELIDNLEIAKSEEADNNLIAIANENSDTEITDVQTAKASIKETNNAFIADMTDSQIALKQVEINSFINEAIESNTGINRNYTYSEAKGRSMGDKASRSFLNTIMPYSAEDFRGLLYVTLGKGEKGEAQMAYYKKNILDPFNAAEGAVTKKQVALASDFQALKALYPTMPKTLKKKIGIGEYTHSDALRVWTWASQGNEIPGLSKTDKRKLLQYVNENPELAAFAQGLQGIQQGSYLQAPSENWMAGNIGMDLMEGISKGERKKYLDQSGWTANMESLYSKENLAKMRAAYGNSYVDALQDNIRRMKSGSNRPVGGNKVTDSLLDWMNNSVGTVMFLNTRSAVLQTLSAVNYVNWSDNNPLAAGKALLNIPQYSSDFLKLMNSEYLVNRRSGLKINVSESEIADAMAQGGKGPKAIINMLLNKGFVLTQYADSFAIASGGATFFRNRSNSYLKETNPETEQKYTLEEAEAKAFIDFQNISEESQQSARTDRISMQQASSAGRVVLAFANTPMQYARIQKRAIQDLMNGRGDAKTHISKLAYYGFIQNAAFNAIQNALYTEMFEDDEEEEVGKSGKQKSWDIVNGMTDSTLRGMGIGGAAVSAIKNSILTLADEATKNSPQFKKAINDLFDFSPPLDSKIRKLNSAANTFSWERDEIERQGFDIDNPAVLASAQILSASTNIPLDRALMKLNNLRNAASKRSEAWQKIALMLGVSAWEVGLPYYGVESMQEEDERLREEEQKEIIRKSKLEKARLEKLRKKREARRKLEERIRADERKKIEKENKLKNK